MAKKIVSLYIDDTSLRLLVTRGKRIKKWADSPLEPGLVRNGVVSRETEVAAKIKLLFTALKLKTKKIVLGVCGLHCLSRPILLPQLPREMLEEAVKREARRILPVPLEQLYLSWQMIPAPEGKTQVFLVAVPRKTVDALYKMLHQLGLKPYLMDLKPLALARAANEDTTIIVDVQPTEFDIVITADGISQPIRTLTLPSGELLWPEKLATISKDLARTIEFYNTNNSENPLAPTVPIFVSGELANEPELCQSLAKELGHPVLPISPPLQCPKAGLDPNHYLVNMGLTLKGLTSDRERRPLVANVNVLPTPYRPQPISLVRILVVPGAATAIGIIAFLVMLIQGASADVASMRGRLSTTDQLFRQKLVQREELTQNIAELERQIATAEKTGKNFTAVLATIQKQGQGVNGLAIAVNNLPKVINLSRVRYENFKLTVDGRSPSEKEILAYLKDLDRSGQFAEITLISLKKIDGEGMDFTLVLKTGE